MCHCLPIIIQQPSALCEPPSAHIPAHPTSKHVCRTLPAPAAMPHRSTASSAPTAPPTSWTWRARAGWWVRGPRGAHETAVAAVAAVVSSWPAGTSHCGPWERASAPSRHAPSSTCSSLVRAGISAGCRAMSLLCVVCRASLAAHYLGAWGVPVSKSVWMAYIWVILATMEAIGSAAGWPAGWHISISSHALALLGSIL